MDESRSGEDDQPESKTESVGYTEESLRMLKTAEGQSNAIFACFGSAAQRAQNFEDGVAKFLVVYNQATNDSLTSEDLESRNDELSRKTMGQLLHRLKKVVTFPDDTYTDYFLEALGRRNFLMHKYFLERNHMFATEASRFEALAELATMENVFNRARIAINAMRIALCETLNIDPGENA
ncbi:MAG TPA: hypothetical protein VGN16_02980 [Acidobacteriaceae bacterium]|jgi:hypothetical protein